MQAWDFGIEGRHGDVHQFEFLCVFDFLPHPELDVEGVEVVESRGGLGFRFALGGLQDVDGGPEFFVDLPGEDLFLVEVDVFVLHVGPRAWLRQGIVTKIDDSFFFPEKLKRVSRDTAQPLNYNSRLNVYLFML
jgi:hypothetical protein